MSLEAFYYISQIIASIAVLASLIYLAQQTRQTARNQRTLMHENRMQTISKDIELIVDPEFAPIWIRGSAGDPSLTDVELIRFQFFCQLWLVQWEERFRQFREGMLDADRWRTSENTIRSWLTQPGQAAVALGFIGRCDPKFATLLQQLMAEPAPAFHSSNEMLQLLRQRMASRVTQK